MADAPSSPRPAEVSAAEPAAAPAAPAVAAPSTEPDATPAAAEPAVAAAAPPAAADKKDGDGDAPPVDAQDAPATNGDDKADAAASPPHDEDTAPSTAEPVAAAAPTPAKKTPKPSRRKSVANFKKGAAAAPGPDIKYAEGQYVLAKMRSFPPWPALVLNKDLLPEVMRVGKPKSLETIGTAAWETQYPIFYLGTYE